MNVLSDLFKPITVSKLNNSPNYVEIEPCELLRPYIRCFWGSPRPFKDCDDEARLVIPDCCMDIIFNIDYSYNKIDNLFCSMNDRPFSSSSTCNQNIISNFGIRFYFWSAYLFADYDFKIECNEFYDVDRYFNNLKRNIETIVESYDNIEDRIIHVERLLANKLCNSIGINDNLANAIYYILKSKGTSKVTDISQYAAISTRQTERIFREHIGISPKKCCSLIRYQNMWVDLVNNNYCNFNELVYRYEFSDQAHMINDFKKYHGSSPQKAVNFLNNRGRSMSHFCNTKLV